MFIRASLCCLLDSPLRRTKPLHSTAIMRNNNFSRPLSAVQVVDFLGSKHRAQPVTKVRVWPIPVLHHFARHHEQAPCTNVRHFNSRHHALLVPSYPDPSVPWTANGTLARNARWYTWHCDIKQYATHHGWCTAQSHRFSSRLPAP